MAETTMGQVWSPDAERYRLIGLWYAWGRLDGGEKDCPDAFKFADALRERRQRYDDGGTFMPSVQGCWSQFKRSGVVTDGLS
jgi:hypothetical protein